MLVCFSEVVIRCYDTCLDMLVSILWYDCTIAKGRVVIMVACCMKLFRGIYGEHDSLSCLLVFLLLLLLLEFVCAWLFDMHVFTVVDATTTAGACADIKPNVLKSFLKFLLENFGFSYLWGLFFFYCICLWCLNLDISYCFGCSLEGESWLCVKG